MQKVKFFNWFIKQKPALSCFFFTFHLDYDITEPHCCGRRYSWPVLLVVADEQELDWSSRVTGKH